LADVQAGRAIERASNQRASRVSGGSEAGLPPPAYAGGSPGRSSPRSSAKWIIALVAAILLLAMLVPVVLIALYLFGSSPPPPNPGFDPRLPHPDDNLVMVLDDPAVRVVVIPEHGGQHGFEGDFGGQLSSKLDPGRYQVQGTKGG